MKASIDIDSMTLAEKEELIKSIQKSIDIEVMNGNEAEELEEKMENIPEEEIEKICNMLSYYSDEYMAVVDCRIEFDAKVYFELIAYKSDGTPEAIIQEVEIDDYLSDRAKEQLKVIEYINSVLSKEKDILKSIKSFITKYDLSFSQFADIAYNYGYDVSPDWEHLIKLNLDKDLKEFTDGK
jgi:hypothetical protein